MPTPSYNKYKSTTIYGNLSVRDLTNSSGSSVIEVASVDLSGNFISRGNSTFTKAVTCNGTITNATDLTTKSYVDSAVSGGSILGLNNTFTGTNIFNNNVDISGNFTSRGNVDLSGNFISRGSSNTFNKAVTCNGTITNATDLTTKSYVDSGISTAISGLASVYSTLANEVKTNTANAFTSTNTFNSNLPTSTQTPTSSTQLTTKSYVDSAVSGSSILGLNNTFTGTKNIFNNNVDISGNLVCNKQISQEYAPLGDGYVNKFLSSTFSQNVVFSGFSQNGSAINYLDNLTLGGASTSNDLCLTYDTGIVQSGTATNTLNNLTLKNSGLIIKDLLETTQISINPTNYITLGDTNTTIIDPQGITQNDTTAINTFKGETTFDNDVNFTNSIQQDVGSIDQDRALPSGAVNKFIQTDFLEIVGFSAGFNQFGTTTNIINNLTIEHQTTNDNFIITGKSITQGADVPGTNTFHNLTLTTGNLTMGTSRINLPTDTITPATSANQLGHRIVGTITGTITSGTQTNLSTISLPYGIYIIVANVVFQSNATTGTISKYQIGFNNISTNTFTSAVVGYGGNTTLATTASNTTQLAVTTTEIYNSASGTVNFRLNANITYATTTMSINTSLSYFTAIRIA